MVFLTNRDRFYVWESINYFNSTYQWIKATIFKKKTWVNTVTVKSLFWRSYSTFWLRTMEGYCQTRFHYLNQKLFNLLTCSMCYQYLFPKNKELRSKGLFLEATSESRYKEGTQILANISNSTFVRNVCKTLEAEGDCARWTDCCNSAIKCCKDQLAAPFLYNGTSHCPRIWDGYGCFGDTLPGVREYIQCPSYIEHGVTHGK